MTTNKIGKRDFSRNPLKFIKMANETDIIICHHGNPEVVISKYNQGIKYSELKHKYQSDNVHKVMEAIFND